MLEARKFVFRYMNMVPFEGFGPVFLNCVQGADSHVLVPFPHILDSGSSVEKITSMLAGLTPAESKKWMNEHSVIANLTSGITMWVPYDCLGWLVSTSDQVSP